MGNISLTSSMRSNLQSLQSIARDWNVVQNRLATGLKVSSAIDNPSSFYTAQSLNNRSADLGALLDSMSQGIQTIKAATQAIDIASKMLEQAKASANKALENIAPPPKEDAGYNGPVSAIVTNEAELLDALANANPADGAIVVAKDIYLNKNVGLTLKTNMKLVGKTGTEKLTFSFDSNTKAIGIELNKDTELSGLAIHYTSVNRINNNEFNAIRNNGYTGVKLRNVDVIVNSNNTQNMYMSGIRNAGRGEIALEGKINISAPSVASGYIWGIYGNGTDSKITQTANSVLNINTSGQYGYGIYGGTNTLSGNINISTSGNNGYGIVNGTNTLSGNINIGTSGNNGYGIVNGTNTLSGNINISTSGNKGYGFVQGNHTFKNTAKVLVESKNIGSALFYADTNKGSYSWEKGAQIGFKNESIAINALWQAGSAGSVVDKTTSTTDLTVAPFNWSKIGNFPGIPPITRTILRSVMSSVAEKSSSSAREISPRATLGRNDNNGALGQNDVFLNGSSQYSSILDQFNQLIKDGGYKGINLLLEQNLKINFNEDRSSGIDVKGVDASTKGLGLETFSWKSAEDIEKSIAELDFAISKLRTFSAEFGNSFSIVSTREKFTESITNVLTEGADKLTLADMNQESANMLALQTRQQLAVNSLSLASRAAQSVLKLF